MHTVDPTMYETLLSNKVDMLTDLYAPFNPPALEVYDSPAQHYRLRAEFRIWHSGERCFYAMFNPGTKSDPIEITEFPVASEQICQLMPVLLAKINANKELSHRLFTVEFLNTLSGDMLVTLIYHRQISEAWQAEAQKLQSELNIRIIGRARNLKIVLERDYVLETLHVDGQQYHYQQIEGSFTQPNGTVNQKMLSWARQVHPNPEGDLLELYCGNGNFSIALANLYKRVVATEISKPSVNAARFNTELNKVDNLQFGRCSAEEFTAHIKGIKALKRLDELNLDECDFKTVLVDPPRAGLDAESCAMISEYENIIYISCNPHTLAENLTELCKTHDIKRLAMFDQFPYTEHVESGVFLVKKP